MHTGIIRAATLGALSAAALIGANVGSPAGVAPARHEAPNGFSGPVSSRYVARPIERDVTVATRATLRLVPCAVAAPTRACFAAR